MRESVRCIAMEHLEGYPESGQRMALTGAHGHVRSDAACRFMAQSLANMVLRFDPDDPEAFVMITGVGDSSTFGLRVASWQRPQSDDELCYTGAPRSHGLVCERPTSAATRHRQACSHIAYT